MGMGPIALLLFVFSCFTAPTYGTDSTSGTKTYIVYMGSIRETLRSHEITRSHHDILVAVLASNEAAKESLVYSYSNGLNGFAADLLPEHADAISELPGVVSVFESKSLEPQTTQSYAFLGLDAKNSLWSTGYYGADTIIGVIDTGIWPESASFNDAMVGPVPSRWKGTCQTGGTFTKYNCNKKLIGARYFSKSVVLMPGEEYSPRDTEGHGTHVASIAAGAYVSNANFKGLATGTAKGGAPQARIAAYKVCWLRDKCNDARVLAAIDQAIADGVDVINLSLGKSPTQPYDILTDGVALGSLHAVQKGIHVIAAGGNSGPASGTVANIAPWMFTVAMSTVDRELRSDVVLGDKRVFEGTSLSTEKLDKAYPLVIAKDIPLSGHANESALCTPGSINPSLARGKILVCEPGMDDMAKAVKDAGGVGLIMTNNKPGIEVHFAIPFSIPGTHVGYSAGAAIVSYIKSSKNPVAYITPTTTVLGYKPAPVMGLASSVGPSIIPDLLKPDITAPGVDILAAWSGANSSNDYEFKTGTSMASPHVAGVTAVLKSAHPKWSPAAIRSAIMTTAYTKDNAGNAILDGFKLGPAGPFNYGSGHINPNAATDPGLVYNATMEDYAVFLCSQGFTQYKVYQVTGIMVQTCTKGTASSCNYPSVSISNLRGSTTITRTVTNVGNAAATYQFSSTQPTGVRVSASPSVLRFSRPDESQSFSLTFKATTVSPDYVFGDFTWTDGKHKVRSPIVVRATSTLEYVPLETI